jgi:hypothetical protein
VIRHSSFVGFCFAVVLYLTCAASADEHLRFPGDVPVDIYHSGGPIGSLTDGLQIVIPFWIAPELIRPDFNLLDTFDAVATELPLLVEGFVRWRDNYPPSWEARGLGAVPFWFVDAAEFAAAAADGELTIVELAALDSLLVGVAGFYQEQNHIYGLHPVSHYTMVASGTLANGRSFAVRFVEVDLVLLLTEIEFR